MKQIRIFSVSVFMAILSVTTVTGQNLWNMQPDGSISWTVKKGEAHSDNIEMSGRFMSDEELLFNFWINLNHSLAKDLTVKKESVSLIPKEKINELKPGK